MPRPPSPLGQWMIQGEPAFSAFMYAEKEWSLGASIAPGIPIWAHMKRHMDKGREYERFQSVGAETDAIVMLLFGGDGLSCVVAEKWQGKVKFDRPTDIGDVAAWEGRRGRHHLRRGTALC